MKIIVANLSVAEMHRLHKLRDLDLILRMLREESERLEALADAHAIRRGTFVATYEGQASGVRFAMAVIAGLRSGPTQEIAPSTQPHPAP